MAQQTAMEALVELMKINDAYKPCMPYLMEIIDEVYLPMEKEQRIRDYNAGYTDAQCNHINDAENYANEQEYLNDKEITDYTIGPFGTPEKK